MTKMRLEVLKILLLLVAIFFMLGSVFKILKEYERAVVFRLGKLLGTKGPGLIFHLPLVDHLKRIDLRLVSIDVPRQDIMTKDNVPVTVDAVVYFQITDPAKAVISIQNIYQSTFLIAQTSLRAILGQVELDELLSRQAKINEQLQQIISVHTDGWGIKIPIVELKEITLPEEMKRVMAKQAETERERRARIIDAQGEYQAAQTLAEAGKILSGNPQSLQLRYLQTLRDISTQPGSTVLFPFPLDLIGPFVDGEKKSLQKNPAIIEQKNNGDQEVSQEKRGASLVTPPQELLARYQQEFREGRLKPRYVQWLSTDHCQFQCAHCQTIANPIAHQTNSKELTTIEVQKMLDELAALGCEFLSIIGGEPLLRPDIFSLTHYAHQRGMKVGLTTNGYATAQHLMALEQAQFDAVVITLDGYRNTQNRIRGCEDAYEQGIRTIEFFRGLGVTSLGISTILLEENLQELPQLVEEVFQAGAHSFQLQPLLMHHGSLSRNSSEVVENAFRFVIEGRRRGFALEIGEAFGYLGQLEPFVRNSPFFCNCGWNTFCVTQNGDVTGCAVSNSAAFKEGNCQTDSLKQIWEHQFTSFRRNIPEGIPETCQECPHVAICRGGCWLFRIRGSNPCFWSEAEKIYQEIAQVWLKSV